MPDIRQGCGEFYDEAWQKWNEMIRFSPAPRLRRTRIIGWLKRYSFASLLDVGCGNGEFLLQLHRSLPDVRLAGTDISGAVIEANRQALPNLEFSTLDLDFETLPRRYDMVTCMEVIEHCGNHADAVRHLAEMTGRCLFLTVPCGPLFEIDRRVGHTHHFGPAEISQLLQSAGLRVVRLEQWGFPFFNLYKYAINFRPDAACAAFLSNKPYSIPQKILAVLTYAMFRISMPFGGYQLFVIAERAGDR